MFTILLTLVAGQVDINNDAQVVAAAEKMVMNLVKYYTAPGAVENGVIKANPASDSSGFQFFEGGIYHGALLEYATVTGKANYGVIARDGLAQLSSAKGTFVQIDVVKSYNDDPMHYAMASVSGAQTYKQQLLQPTINTLDQVFGPNQVDGLCHGGVYWFRDRTDKDKGDYKSVAVQGQIMNVGPKLTIQTGDKKYLQRADDVYQSLKAAQLISKDWDVYDGNHMQRQCTINIDLHSYQAGLVLGGLGHMFKASQNHAYLDDAYKILDRAITSFTTNGVVIDKCEQTNQKNCQKNQVTPKGLFVRGLGDLYQNADNQAVKDKIKQILKQSTSQMFKTCSVDFGCGNDWVGATKGTDIHQQMNAVELVTAYLKTIPNIANIPAAPAPAPATPAPAPAANPAPAAVPVASPTSTSGPTSNQIIQAPSIPDSPSPNTTAPCITDMAIPTNGPITNGSNDDVTTPAPAATQTAVLGDYPMNSAITNGMYLWPLVLLTYL